MSVDESPPNRPPASGWYPDPAGGPDLRWWDGAAWSGEVGRPDNARWSDWFFSWPPAVKVSRAVMVAAGAGIVIAATIVLLTLVQARPLPGLAVLLVPAIPALLVGQVWEIAVLNARIPSRPFAWRQLTPAAFSSSWKNMRQVVSGPLPARAAYPLHALFYIGWLAAMTGMLEMRNGTPHGGTRECLYQLIGANWDNGKISCVSLTTYQHAGAAVQRLIAGIALAFFAMHFMVAWSELARRRETAG